MLNIGGHLNLILDKEVTLISLLVIAYPTPLLKKGVEELHSVIYVYGKRKYVDGLVVSAPTQTTLYQT